MRAYLISGIPGAGKTTVSRALAERLVGPAVHIEGDVLSFDFVAKGVAEPSDSVQWADQMRLRRKNIRLLADSYAEEGFSTVIDDVVVSRAAFGEYDALLAVRPTFVVLSPSLDVVRARDKARDKHVFEMWNHLEAEMRAELTGIGNWIDSSDLSVGETVDRILKLD